MKPAILLYTHTHAYKHQQQPTTATWCGFSTIAAGQLPGFPMRCAWSLLQQQPPSLHSLLFLLQRRISARTTPLKTRKRRGKRPLALIRGGIPSLSVRQGDQAGKMNM